MSSEMSPWVEPASFFSASDMVRPRVEDRLEGGGEGPLTAGGKLARKRRRCSDGRRREGTENGRREEDQNDRGENLNPFYPLAFLTGRITETKQEQTERQSVRRQDRREKFLKQCRMVRTDLGGNENENGRCHCTGYSSCRNAIVLTATLAPEASNLPALCESRTVAVRLH